MTRIKYVSIHERDDGKRRIKPGKGDATHSTMRLPKPDNDVDEWTSHDWERVAFYDLPESMPKSDFVEWWNDNLNTDDEPEVIDTVLREMGEREGAGDE